MAVLSKTNGVCAESEGCVAAQCCSKRFFARMYWLPHSTWSFQLAGCSHDDGAE